jgi:hypothetical protein
MDQPQECYMSSSQQSTESIIFYLSLRKLYQEPRPHLGSQRVIFKYKVNVIVYTQYYQENFKPITGLLRGVVIFPLLKHNRPLSLPEKGITISASYSLKVEKVPDA